MTRKLIVTIKSFAVLFGGIGLYTAWPKKLTKSFYKPTPTSGRAYILNEKYGSPIAQIKRGQKYIKKNDEAVVFWVGGPRLGKNWDIDMKDYAHMFGQTKHSKDLAKNKVEGNYDIPFDIYAGVQMQWEGIKGNDYHSEMFKASNTTGFINSYSQRPLTIGDVKFRNAKTKTLKERVKDSQKMFDDNAKQMHQLAKDLKAFGYKKVHYIAHSFGTFFLSEYIKQYGDSAFENVDTIQIVGGRLKGSDKIKKSFTGKSFPYMGYNKETKLYDTVVHAPIFDNAVTKGVAMPIFLNVIEKNYIPSYKKLSDDNKRKVKIVATDFDWRVGSMEKDELDLKNHGLNVVVVKNDVLRKYEERYLLQKEHKFADKPKDNLLKKGINHHDTVFRWYLDNTLSKGKGSNWKSKEPMIMNKQTYWCSLKEHSNVKFLETNCQK